MFSKLFIFYGVWSLNLPSHESSLRKKIRLLKVLLRQFVDDLEILGVRNGKGPKTQHIRIGPTGFVYPKKRKPFKKMSIQCGHRAKRYINGVYNYPLWMAENKWVTGVIYPNLLIGVITLFKFITGWGAPCIVLIGHLPSGFYEQIAIMEHLLIMSSLVQHKFNTR